LSKIERERRRWGGEGREEERSEIAKILVPESNLSLNGGFQSIMVLEHKIDNFKKSFFERKSNKISCVMLLQQNKQTTITITITITITTTKWNLKQQKQKTKNNKNKNQKLKLKHYNKIIK
jgi:hypothetical protein